jgi:hypothetical protein
MGLRNWLANRRKDGDELAIKRAEDRARSGSYEERETIAGDMEGLAADNRVEGRGQMWTGSDVDPRSRF